jgi:hypothetical protein
MNKWICPEDFNPEDYTGFVYKITNLTNGKFYIGKKSFFHNTNIKLGKNVLQLTADIFNLTNLLNNEWGQTYFISNSFNSTSSVGLAKGTGEIFTFTKPTQKPYSVDQIASKWQVQLGVRLSF